MRQGKRYGGMVHGAMGDRSAAYRLAHPELRNGPPATEKGQIWEYYADGPRIKILEVREREYLVEAISGPAKGKVGTLATWIIRSGCWNLVVE